jgi:hypothetical protein
MATLCILLACTVISKMTCLWESVLVERSFSIRVITRETETVPRQRRGKGSGRRLVASSIILVMKG